MNDIMYITILFDEMLTNLKYIKLSTYTCLKKKIK
jgi:hypothetical protein